MTFSILARDEETGAFGGAAATGNLCVGGWVLRGDPASGLSASQGKTPSTLWGEDALRMMREDIAPEVVLDALTGPDPGRETRQLALLAPSGATAVFHGQDNHPVTGHVAEDGWIVAGNWLASRAVLEATAEAFARPGGDFEARLLRGLEAGTAAGSDTRGTLSAALLVTAADRPPLSLRVDWDESPVARLRDLHRRTRAKEYTAWLETLPTRARPGLG